MARGSSWWRHQAPDADHIRVPGENVAPEEGAAETQDAKSSTVKGGSTAYR